MIRKKIFGLKLKVIHWLIYAAFVFAFLSFTIFAPRLQSPNMYFWFSRLFAIFILVYLPKIIIFLFSSLGAIRYLIRRIVFQKTRRKYFIINEIGLVLATLCFIIMLYGFSFGRYNYKVKNIEIVADNIPQSFDGYKIIHITDIHLGSYGKSYKGVKKAVDIINTLDADVIAFSGDMVNNFASEMNLWMDELKRLKAKDAKYSILGNHDYGHYVRWDSKEAEESNLRELIEFQEEVGFDVLLDEKRTLHHSTDSIVIVGVQNWGKPPFPSIGDLNKAMQGVKDNAFTVLMSHDPNHWEAEVWDRNIELTLSGHTHAMQVGIEIPGFKWSPAKYLYKYWDGLYQKGNKYLNVNRGLGYIAFPGRIGLRPEITVITLRSKK
jgi:predicted MPP superfamily phosphohydrolase